MVLMGLVYTALGGGEGVSGGWVGGEGGGEGRGKEGVLGGWGEGLARV
jgi:hypothetical protein